MPHIVAQLTCGDRSDEHGGELDDGRVAQLPALVGVRPHAARPDRRRVELKWAEFTKIRFESKSKSR